MRSRSLVGLAAATVLLLGAAWAAQRVIAPEAGTPPPREAPEPEDSGPVMDLEHLNEADLAFLAEVLGGEDPKARQSAARALAVSGDLRGVPMLFRATALEDGQDALYCLAALEILRLQQAPDAWRELLFALEAQPPLPQTCLGEVEDRFALVDARLRDPERIGLLTDPELQVRRAAWRSWQGRDGSGHGDALSGLAAAEVDPELRRLALEVVASF